MFGRDSKKIIFDGTTKTLYDGPNASSIIMHFKDNIDSLIEGKGGVIPGKGAINNKVSSIIMERLNEIGIPTHLIKSFNMKEQLVKELDIFPIKLSVRNVVSGNFAKLFNIEEGLLLSNPIIEFVYKSRKLKYPLINEDHIITFGWASAVDVEEMKHIAMRLNDFLVGFFSAVRIRLIDFTIEFGRYIIDEDDSRIHIADEISLDTCNLWDMTNNQKLDSTALIESFEQIEDGYREVARRLGILA